MNTKDNIHRLTAHLFRENSGKMTAVLCRKFGVSQIETILDVVQETFETALVKWRFSGIPDNPPAWLMQVARNKAINVFKREGKTHYFSPLDVPIQEETSLEGQFDFSLSPHEINDSQLRLLLSCCNQAISPRNQIVITLNILCGFGLPEIANALLMKEESVKKALARSKATLRSMDDILQAKPLPQAGEQINTVLTILYLIFNEGYKTTRTKKAINNDLCYEAIRLTKILLNNSSITHEETYALLSLMFFNLSRFPARLNSVEEWLSLEEQDRSKWNDVFIEEGYYYLNKATKGNELSRFHIEAIIASLHCSAPSFHETDWEKITFLYRQLEILEPSSPFISLNRVIAESFISDPQKSLHSLDKIRTHEVFKDSFLLPAVKGNIYNRKGELQNAIRFYSKALELAQSPTDKSFLQRKIVECKSLQN